MVVSNQQLKLGKLHPVKCYSNHRFIFGTDYSQLTIRNNVMSIENTIAYQESMRCLDMFINKIKIIRLKIETDYASYEMDENEKDRLLRSIRLITNKTDRIPNISPEERIALCEEMTCYYGLSVDELANLVIPSSADI